MEIGKITQNQLNKMIEDHQDWLADPIRWHKKQLIFTGEDLIGLRFTGDLSGAKFTKTNISFCIFKDVKLFGVRFVSTNASHSVFENCSNPRREIPDEFDATKFTDRDGSDTPGDPTYLIKTKFIDCDFDQFYFEGYHHRLNCIGMEIVNSKFRYLAFTKADWGSGSLLNSEIVKSHCYQSRCHHLKIENSPIAEYAWIESDFTMANIDKIDSYPNSRNNHFRDLNFGLAKLGDVNFTQSKLLKCKFPQTEFINRPTFQNATFEQVEFLQAEMSNSNLMGLKAYDTTFAKSNLSDSDIFSSHLSRSDFSECNLDKCVFLSADLSGAILLNASINETVFERANLSGAQFPDGKQCAAGSIGQCL
ncbi:pentapeptide repeat-containing protein [Ekhidna sp.]|uniref:pentapeptide repeat-containing protein n=1 Tax=Ekhidna sp. TaxID=2608089 RepID=UPI003C7D63FD